MKGKKLVGRRKIVSIELQVVGQSIRKEPPRDALEISGNPGSLEATTHKVLTAFTVRFSRG